MLLACAQDGQTRPSLEAAVDLLKGAARMRLRPRPESRARCTPRTGSSDRAAKAKRMEEVIRGYFDACESGDADAVARYFAPGAVHYFPPDMYQGPFRGGETIGAKRRVVEGASEEDDDWKIGHPLVFPYRVTGAGAGADVGVVTVEPDRVRVGGDIQRGWFPADAERHRRDAPRYCPACAAALALAEDGQGLVTEYWTGQDRVFVCFCFCGACGWSGDIVLADRVVGHEAAG